MPDPHPHNPPSPFIETWIRRLSAQIAQPRRALDVAMGRGRHALLLAGSGYHTYGVDINLSAVVDAQARARASGLTLHAWCADLTKPALPPHFFELIVVTRYLQRTLSAALTEALVPGGFLLYETFTESQRSRGRGPQSPDHLLATDELRSLFPDLTELFYEELTDPGDDALARLAARKRSSPS
jgi:SAM-dependent methyltransferase